MSDFTVHTPETAPGSASESLQASQKAFGFIPNLHAVMAEQPALLEAYKTMSALSAQTGLSAVEQQVVFQVSNFENGCTYCVAAHSVISDGQKVPAEVTEALRAGKLLADPKLEALAAFTRLVVTDRGWVSEEDQQAFFGAGYSNKDALAVIVLVSMRVLSNYTNHIAETPLDAAFKSREWQKPAA